MNSRIISNFSKINFSLFFAPLFLLASIVFFLYRQDALSVSKYVEIQKKYFYFINFKLSQFPNTIYNITQIGDALIFLSFLTIFVVYAPKIWESLLSSLIVSVVFSSILKDFFRVPRPAAAFDNSTFIIIGKTLPGYSSLPSGHAITVFTIITILLFAFMPQKLNFKIIWYVVIISIGLLIAYTRVGVGAHHPLDVIIGSIIGYICGISGILINQKYQIWSWINNKKYYPVFIILFLVCSIIMITKILNENLIIFYLSLICLIISLYKIIYVYTKK
ncbi:MAG: phosphatase PAP2 family protein [Flavobacterium sp.]|nr:phosphatase PAP2 family protein [Flavobacterium sp.]